MLPLRLGEGTLSLDRLWWRTQNWCVTYTVEVDEQALSQLQDLAVRSGHPLPRLVHDAVDSLHRSLVGSSSIQLHLPFKKRWSELDAEILLRQVSATGFELDEPFRFEEPGHQDIVVRRGDATDLASVPSFLTWLVPRYGRHTLPALLHDQLVVGGMDPNDREKADATFRDAMGGTRVPLVMRWVMWAAISLATHLLRAWRWKVLIAAWVALYGLAGLDSLLAVLGWRPVSALSSAAVLALIWVSPVLLSVIWGRRYRFGLIVAYSLLVLPASVISVAATIILYRLLEVVAQVALLLMRRRGASVQVNPVELSNLEYTQRGEVPPGMPPPEQMTGT